MPWSLRTADGVELVVHGPERPTRPVAVVLHGVGSTADFALRCFLEPLQASGYDVLAPDLRGHGASTALPDPAHHALASHVADLDELTRRIPVRLVAGISLGAEVALRWLAMTAAALDGALLCLPGIAGPTSRAADANRAAADALARRGVEAVLGDMTTAPGALPWVVEEVHASWRRHDPASLVAALRAVAACEPLDTGCVSGVRVPVVVVGVTDDAGHPVEVAATLARSLPHAALELTTLADLADDRAALGRAALTGLRRAHVLAAPPPG